MTKVPLQSNSCSKHPALPYPAGGLDQQWDPYKWSPALVRLALYTGLPARAAAKPHSQLVWGSTSLTTASTAILAHLHRWPICPSCGPLTRTPGSGDQGDCPPGPRGHLHHKTPVSRLRHSWYTEYTEKKKQQQQQHSKWGKMRRQRNTFQTREQDKPQKRTKQT